MVVMHFFTALPPTIAALAALLKARHVSEEVQRLHVNMNGKLVELLVSARATSHAEGKEEGRLQEEERMGRQIARDRAARPETKE